MSEYQQVVKFGSLLGASEELLWMMSTDPAYQRKVERVIEHRIPWYDWVAWWLTDCAFRLVQRSKFYRSPVSYVGEYEEDYQVPRPEPRQEVVYAETEDEWRERCRLLDASGFKRTPVHFLWGDNLSEIQIGDTVNVAYGYLLPSEGASLRFVAQMEVFDE